jgi:hypothetical protein
MTKRALAVERMDPKALHRYMEKELVALLEQNSYAGVPSATHYRLKRIIAARRELELRGDQLALVTPRGTGSWRDAPS